MAAHYNAWVLALLSLRARWMWWGAFVLVGLVAVNMTARAYREGLPAIFLHPGADKVAHFTFAGLLAFFLDGALGHHRVFRHVPLAAVLVLVPCGIEEIAQGFSIHRTSSIWDYAADVVGVAVLLAISYRRRGSA